MPGIAGMIWKNPYQVNDEVLDHVSGSLLHFENYHCGIVRQDHFFACAVDLNNNPLDLYQHDSIFSAAAIGEIYADQSGSVPEGSGSLAKHFCLQQEKGNENFISGLEGKFACALWDHQNRELKLIADKFGLYPIYYQVIKDGFVFSSELKTIIRVSQMLDPVKIELDELGVLEYFTFGHQLDTRTLLKNVSILPSGSVLSFQFDRGIRLRKYYDITFRPESEKETEFAAYIPEHQHLMTEIVQQRVFPGEQIDLALSGGLDSRTLAGYFHRQGIPFTSSTFGFPKNIDVAAAEQVARVVNAPHQFYHYQPQYIASHANEAVFLMDGMCRLGHLHFMFLAQQAPSHASRFLFSGYMGDVPHGLGLAPTRKFAPDLRKVDSRSGLVRFIKDKHASFLPLHVHQRAFENFNIDRLHQDLENELSTVLDRAHSNNFFHQAEYYRFTQREWRWITLDCVVSPRYFRKEVRVPFADSRLIDFLYSLPLSARYNQSMYIQSFCDAFPDLANIPGSSTLAPVNAGDFSNRLGTLKIYWQYGLKLLVDKASRGKMTMNVPWVTYQYGDWLRKELQPWIKEIVFDPKTLSRSIIQKSFIEAAVNDHMAGRKDWAEFLFNLATFELWTRMFIENDSVPSLG